MSLKTNKEILKKERKNVRIDKLAKGQIIPLKQDFMFTQIFNDENYDFVLYQLLSDVLSIKKEVFIGNIRYLNRDLKNSNKKNMLNKVDLLIKHKMFNEDGNEEEEYINVEINTSNSMLRRNKVYSNKIGSFSLDVGDNTYDNIDRLVQVNFDFFDTNKLRLVSISQMKDQDNIIDTGWDDIFYTISVNFALNPWYNLIDEREKKVANWCILMNTNDLEIFKRKAEEIMGKEDAEKLKGIISGNGYESNSEKEENKEDEDMYVPEVIAPEESWEQDYPTITHTYYEGDGILTDDHDKIITNADELVGHDFAQHFGEYEEDSVYVRNSKLKVHYEILRDYGAYSDRMSESE